MATVVDLDAVRDVVVDHCETLRDKNGPFGSYRPGRGARPDLYSSTDVALMRAIMGENLRATLSTEERGAWAEHINSFANNDFGKPTDGGYFDTLGHSAFHGNGEVIGALGVLGERQRFAVRLYDAFDTPPKATAWLETINWEWQWPASHLFWGGMVCFSLSRRCTPEWRATVHAWLDENLDAETGWWRRGVAHADKRQPLGGAAHIWPFYQHHGFAFPYPHRVLDSILALQNDDGVWNDGLEHRTAPVPHHYLELDALYGLWMMRTQAPDYRPGDVARCAERYADALMHEWDDKRDVVLSRHPHWILSYVGALGLLQRLLPDRFRGSAAWTDIFSDRRLHDTAAVEADETQETKVNS